MNSIASRMILLTTFSMTISFGNCSNPPPSGPPPAKPTPTATSEPPKKNSPTPESPTPLPKPKVRILGFRFEKSATRDDYRKIIVDVVNDSDFDATFDTSCGWQCPGGRINTWGISVEQGTYLKAKSRRSISTDNRLGCEPIPSFLQVNCKITWNKDNSPISEWNGSATVPF